jgi:hypothetical protein
MATGIAKSFRELDCGTVEADRFGTSNHGADAKCVERACQCV